MLGFLTCLLIIRLVRLAADKGLTNGVLESLDWKAPLGFSFEDELYSTFDSPKIDDY